MLVGADGCPGGWAFAACDAPGGPVLLGRVSKLSGLLDALPDVRVLAVDMPIGLPRHGVRRCDIEGKALLGARHSTLFAAPPAGVLRATSYQQACEVALAATGKKISLQAWNLVPKIREVASLKHRPSLRAEIVETHPEIVFDRLAGGSVVAASKKSPEGQSRRLGLLRAWFGRQTLNAAVEAGRLVGRGAPLVDQIDALVCLVAAQRWVSATHKTAPCDPSHDEPVIAY